MRRILLAFMLILAVSVVIGYLLVQDGDNRKFPSEAETEDAEEIEERREIDPIQEQLDKLSLEEKVGQLVMVGLEGSEVDEHAAELIETYRVGGFIFFKRNISNVAQTVNLVNSLMAKNSGNKIPLFLSVDEEGGRVSRMPEDFVDIPTNQKIGEINDPKLSFQVGRILAAQVESIGLNLNFAPVLDINSNPENPVIGDRAFGSQADVVRRLGVQTMKGLQGQGVISVVKHFPGHGDTAVDSHIGLPRVDNDLERLRSLELVPFTAAIQNGADAVMIAHILLPMIDPDNPATFSPAIITGLLREELGFTGVVITDDLTMGAIVENFDIGEAAVNSIKAGSDIVLVCHDYAKEEAVIKAVRQAAESGVISTKRIDESVYRILKLKKKYGLSDKPVQAGDVQTINEQIKALFSGLKL